MAGTSMKVGGGGRFKKLERELKQRKSKTKRGRKAAASRPGGGKVKDTGALAAWIGRKKYGKEQFQKMAVTGRKRGK